MFTLIDFKNRCGERKNRRQVYEPRKAQTILALTCHKRTVARTDTVKKIRRFRYWLIRNVRRNIDDKFDSWCCGYFAVIWIMIKCQKQCTISIGIGDLSWESAFRRLYRFLFKLKCYQIQYQGTILHRTDIHPFSAYLHNFLSFFFLSANQCYWWTVIN